MRHYLQPTMGLLLLAALSAPAGGPQGDQKLLAPTYYLAIAVKDCTSREVTIRGVTNLPTGSVIALKVSEFAGSIGWTDYGADSFAVVEGGGLFQGKVPAKENLSFRSNLLAIATFSTYHPRQPTRVLEALGKKGERLGDIENPQLAYRSGNYKILGTIARVGPCGPN